MKVFSLLCLGILWSFIALGGTLSAVYLDFDLLPKGKLFTNLNQVLLIPNILISYAGCSWLALLGYEILKSYEQKERNDPRG